MSLSNRKMASVQFLSSLFLPGFWQYPPIFTPLFEQLVFCVYAAYTSMYCLIAACTGSRQSIKKRHE